MNNNFGPLILAIVTPFKNNDEIDYEVFKELLYKASGHDSVVICGSTGEGESLTIQEKYDLLCFAKKNSKLKIIYAISEPNTKKAIEEINYIHLNKPDGILLTVPSYYKAPKEGIIKHYHNICSLFREIPFIIYNIPSRTGTSLDYLTIKTIVEQNENIIGLKDCSSDLDMVKKCVVNLPNFDVYCGNDNELLEYMNVGAKGLVSVISIVFEKIIRSIIDDHNSGFNNIILDSFIKYASKKINIMINPIGIKAFLEMQGYDSMNLRLPLIKMPNCLRGNLENIL